jgi:hypothetical protein
MQDTYVRWRVTRYFHRVISRLMGSPSAFYQQCVVQLSSLLATIYLLPTIENAEHNIRCLKEYGYLGWQRWISTYVPLRVVGSDIVIRLSECSYTSR